MIVISSGDEFEDVKPRKPATRKRTLPAASRPRGAKGAKDKGKAISSDEADSDFSPDAAAGPFTLFIDERRDFGDFF